MAQRSHSRDSDKYIIRMPDGLRGRIKSHAAANNRTMNAEIISVLEAAFPAPVEDDLLIAAKAVVSRWYSQDWKEGDLWPALKGLCAAIAKAEEDE